MPDYGNPSYWDERYAAHDTTFDWYQTHDSLKQHIYPILSQNPNIEILVPGCGNSSLSAQLYENGYQNISNVDISSVVISQMKRRYSELGDMEFSVLDVCNIGTDLDDSCFDVIIDKALLDSILCSDDSISRVREMMHGFFRILKPGGVYICVSFGAPSTRLSYLQQSLTWEIDVKPLEKPAVAGSSAKSSEHYMYICRK